MDSVFCLYASDHGELWSCGGIPPLWASTPMVMEILDHILNSMVFKAFVNADDANHTYDITKELGMEDLYYPEHMITRNEIGRLFRCWLI